VQIDLSIVLGLGGLFIGSAALVATFILHAVRSERQRGVIEANLKGYTENSEKILSNSLAILDQASQLTASHHLRPELSAYLVNQWQFVEKTFRNRYEKHDICRRIVVRHIKDGSCVLLDSGSSVDLVTYELLTAKLKMVRVFSNNVFAAIHLVGTKEITFSLFAGEFSEKFAAVYSREFNNRIEALPIDVYILAATAIRFGKGLMVNKKDRDNADFKCAVLQTFARSDSSRLIIAVDATKFLEPVDQHQTVVSEDEWADLLSSHCDRIYIVTSLLRPEADPDQAAAVDQEWRKFRSAGIVVDVGSEIEIKSEKREL
jgi:DeoR/GlpR family transcriptional regulator of sugar metabolism